MKLNGILVRNFKIGIHEKFARDIKSYSNQEYFDQLIALNVGSLNLKSPSS
jgi:hypothetical protein